MDLIDKLNDIAKTFEKAKSRIQTEEATKFAMIAPFIDAIGYNTRNPMEVEPEFTADVGIKKGEKVDYCIYQNDKAIILVECKHHEENLDNYSGQLYRYFGVTTAKIGLLTNGLEYRFYTDLDETNKMDQSPFFEFDIRDLNNHIIAEIKKFTKDKFDIDQIKEEASGMKHKKLIKEYLNQQFIEVEDDFVEFVGKQKYQGRFTANVKEQFKVIVQNSLKEIIFERVEEKLKKQFENLRKEEEENKEQYEKELEEKTPDDKGILTTEKEKTGFLIVKAILSKVVDLGRVYQRDTKSYFGILFDDNNRKPICRLLFNNESNLQIVIFIKDKDEQKYKLDNVEDIYKYADQLCESAQAYLND